MTRTSGGPDPGGRVLHPGRAEGELLVLTAPISLWGGVDPRDGRVIDLRHPEHGETITGRVLALPAGRGSSSSSSVLAESVRAGTGPVAILLRTPDPILALGALVAEELYGIACPVAVLAADDYAGLRSGDRVAVDATGATPTLSFPDQKVK